MQKIRKMNATDADALHTMPIEDTTESIRTKHESGKPGAMLNRATRYKGEAQARAPTWPQHAAGEAGPAKGPRSATEPRKDSPTSWARRHPGTHTTAGSGSATFSPFESNRKTMNRTALKNSAKRR